MLITFILNSNPENNVYSYKFGRWDHRSGLRTSRTKKYSKVNFLRKAIVPTSCPTSERSVLFFDTCLNLGQLFSYNFKNLDGHLPENLIQKLTPFWYCMELFETILKSLWISVPIGVLECENNEFWWKFLLC